MGCAKVMRMKLIDYFGPLFYNVVDLQVVCLVKSTTPQASLHFYPHRINEGCYFFFHLVCSNGTFWTCLVESPTGV